MLIISHKLLFIDKILILRYNRGIGGPNPGEGPLILQATIFINSQIQERIL